MSSGRSAGILRQLEQPGLPDPVMLERFVLYDDQAAFGEIVRRHGPLVWATCRRVAGHNQDAEDAFQAVFLVLARKAATLRERALLGNWLYGVAVRVARRARLAASRRRGREVQVPLMPDPPAPPPPELFEVSQAIDEELAALPAWYRDPIVLCDLRGVSRTKAAELLGIPEGTLSSRLANGRKKLAARLLKRGVSLSVAAIPGVLATVARATVPQSLLTLASSIPHAAVSSTIAALTTGELSMRLLWLMGTVCMAAGVVGIAYAAQQPQPNKPITSKNKPTTARVEPAPNSKPEADDKRADKQEYTTSPKLMNAFDLNMKSTSSVMWNRDGTLMAIQGRGPARRADAKQDATATEPIIMVIPLGKGDGSWLGILSTRDQLIGFTNSGKGLMTAIREYELVSGKHAITFLEPEPERGGGTTYQKPSQTVALDSTMSRGMYFSPDMKTFRSIEFDRDGAGTAKKLSILEIDANTGKTLKTLMTHPYVEHWLSPDGKLFAFFDNPEVGKATKFVIYDVDRAEEVTTIKLPEPTNKLPDNFPGGRPGGFGGPSGGFGSPNRQLTNSLTFSPNGERVLITYGLGEVVIANTKTGATFPALKELVGMVQPSSVSFSGDGQLIAISGLTTAVPTLDDFRGNPRANRERSFLTVWETNSGKLLKSWDGQAKVLFNPVRPVLAILERNGNDSRLGFWDFAAEPAKK